MSTGTEQTAQSSEQGSAATPVPVAASAPAEAAPPKPYNLGLPPQTAVPGNFNPKFCGEVMFDGRKFMVRLLNNREEMECRVDSRLALQKADSLVTLSVNGNEDVANASWVLTKAMAVTVSPDDYWIKLINGFERDYVQKALDFLKVYSQWENEKILSVKNS